MSPSTTTDPTLHLPRVLTLHGGGTNGTIFTVQLRSLLSLLSSAKNPRFRFVAAEAPFLCPPHPAVADIYASHAPFRRWLRWLSSHPKIDDESAIEEISYSIRSAMAEDDRKGGTGEWVGLIGFSQGAKVAGSILLEQQVREDAMGLGKGIGVCGVEGVRWKFGVLMAGRAPLTALNLELQAENVDNRELNGAGSTNDTYEFTEDGGRGWVDVPENCMIRAPTVHVHGLKDEGLELHRRLLREYCEMGSARLVEWDGDHRVPIKMKDVERVASAMLDAARRAGVEVPKS
jgi:hypothetical protein